MPRHRLRQVAPLWLLLGLLGAEAGVARQDTQRCAEPPPAGFATLDAVNRDGPWVFDARTRSPLTAFGRQQSIPVRLDDGATAVGRILEAPCGREETCDPVDCGCLRIDRHRLEVAGARGDVRRADFWLPYGEVTIVPVDLVGGAGDELVVIRIPGRSAPPAGHEVKIWRLDGPAPRDLGPGIQIAGRFVTTPIGCAQWRRSVSIDVRAPKPRSLSMTAMLGATGCCVFDDDEQNRLEAVRRPALIKFDPSSGTYVLERDRE